MPSDFVQHEKYLKWADIFVMSKLQSGDLTYSSYCSDQRRVSRSLVQQASLASTATVVTKGSLSGTDKWELLELVEYLAFHA